MFEALAYFVTLALFSFVILATARMKHEMLVLACIPPVFVAVMTGFVMAFYAWGRFGPGLVLPAMALPAPVAWKLGRRYTPRALLIAIFLAWALGMAAALIAFQFPDAGT
jgi:hypothetical protein